MKIIVIGDGKVGQTIIENISKEGHDVTIIDKNPKVIDELVNKYDCLGIVGNGASYDILTSANAKSADLVIASTSSDEINILACLLSKRLGSKSTIARIRNYEYSSQLVDMKELVGLDMVINPELETANDILNIIKFPEAIHVDRFAGGKVDFVELYIPDDSPLIGMKLMNIASTYKVKVLICAVQRGEEVFIPNGTFKLQAKDKVYVNSERDNIKKFLDKLGLISENKIKNVMLIGGGIIANYLAESLSKNKYNVVIIEKNYERCLALEESLQKAIIIHGDGTDHGVLEEAGIDAADAVVTLTGMDEENIILSMYADQLNVNKVIAKVDKRSFISIINTIGNVSVVSPKDITSSRIIQYVRSKSNKHGANIINFYKLLDNKMEAIEFKATKNNKVIGKAIKDLKLKTNILIASIIRDKEVIIPSGLDSIQDNDSVIIVTSGLLIDEIDDILE